MMGHFVNRFRLYLRISISCRKMCAMIDNTHTHTSCLYPTPLLQKVLFVEDEREKHIGARYDLATQHDLTALPSEITRRWSMLNRYHIDFAAHSFFFSLFHLNFSCWCYSLIVKCYSNHDSCYSVRGFTKLISRQRIVWLTRCSLSSFSSRVLRSVPLLKALSQKKTFHMISEM